MKICISAGHAKDVRGMQGPSPWGLEEVDEARRVTARVGELLNAGGVPTKTWWDDISQTQDENLDRICDWHNSQQRDIDCSIHFNSADPPGHGCEVFYETAHDLAEAIVDKVCAASGLTNRGPKTGNLYFLSNTAKPAVLVEVCFGNHQGDCETYRRAFEPICLAIAEGLAGHELGSEPDRPDKPEQPPGPQARPTIGLGDQGDDVVALQTSLGVLIADGDFGLITETWVQAFQRACGLQVDGVVGPATWEQVDALDKRMRVGEPALPPALAQKIWTMAQESEIADYSWPGRGVAPPGYVPGIALCFAHAMTRSGEAVAVMSRAQSSPDLDALAWYEAEFKQNGMSNKKPGLDTLRHLFVMMMGLGPRESSGKYYEGRDMSATNVESTTAEAGLFQTSWNIKAGSSAIPPLLGEFWNNPHGFLTEFKEGLGSPTSSNLNSYGSGDGVRYQWLSRFCPLFHVLVTGVGMRCLRQHWGPINRREVTIKREADILLQDVQSLVDDEGAIA
jgi:N-acetylmuramoyl-L-alanine amidase/Putative peptidoglycan binding domain